MSWKFPDERFFQCNFSDSCPLANDNTAQILQLIDLAGLVQNAFPNAYTLAIAGKQPFIMLNTGLLELLSPEELQGVIAHEVSTMLSCAKDMWVTAVLLLFAMRTVEHNS